MSGSTSCCVNWLNNPGGGKGLTRWVLPLKTFSDGGFLNCRLGIPNLGIDDKYQAILQNYGHDIEMVSKLYTKQKNDPPMARNFPPVAGKILWARQLFHRIQEPMSLFQQHPTALRTAEAKSIIRNYNRVAKVLLEFEVVYHQGWLHQVMWRAGGRGRWLSNTGHFDWR